MFAAMTRAAERWRAVKITDFEQRQMAALRTELDHEYEAQTGLKYGTSKAQPQNQLSSILRFDLVVEAGRSNHSIKCLFQLH